jgi:type III pantothenate kinase
MILLLDIGNTHTHVGLATQRRVVRHCDIPTRDWQSGKASRALRRFVGREARVHAGALCSVVPHATPAAVSALQSAWGVSPTILGPETLVGVGLDYPRPASIGPDRLSNAIAVHQRHGAPALVVDFGTAVTFDVVDRRGRYVGGVIAPGLAAMTDYLHEKTALLPRIRIRECRSLVGRSTEEAMLIGAVHGYRGLVRELIRRLRRGLRVRRLPVVATGGYAALMARGVPEITSVEPLLTLEGLRLLHLLSAGSRLKPARATRRLSGS